MVITKKYHHFLIKTPDITTKFKQYCKENLSELSVEFLFECLHNTIVQKMVHDTFGGHREELGEQK
jgi:hypothetical protein